MAIPWAQIFDIGGDAFAAWYGSNAAGKAADTQSAAGIEAAKLQAQTADKAMALQEQMYLSGVQQQAPWQQTGAGAVLTLKDLMQPGQYLSQGAAPFTGSMTDTQTQMDPGFDFRLKEAQKAIERSAAARGGLLSGATAKALDRYSQDYASGEYSNAYNRSLDKYKTNYGVEQGNQTNLYNRLAGLAGTGQTAAQTSASLGQSTANNMSNTAMQGATGTSDYLTSAAAARASGYVGGANAITQGVNNATNTLSDYYWMKQLGK